MTCDLRLFALLGCLLLSAPAADGQYLRIYYPDIEQGSATLVVSPTGQAMLIDAGTGLNTTDDGVEEFINDLIDAGIVTSLDFTLATHYDEDHIGRMENVFQLVPLPPGVIAYDRGEFFQVPSTFAYSDYAFGAGLNGRTAAAICDVLDLGGGVTAQVITVNGDVCGGGTIDITGSGQFENSASVAVVVQFGDVDVWIGGDLTGNPMFTTDVETDAGPQVGDVDVYTFNHHGSDTSSNSSFLADLAAEVGINQNSASNNFGHPRSIVVDRFLMTPDSSGGAPLFFQQNPGNAGDTRSDDSLASGIADCDDVDGAFGLPGTLTLLSDGTSYRLHACGIAATTFPADEGPGTLGDYPPAIRRVLRTPLVPLASESVTVEADIDEETSVTAEVRYEINGVAQTPIAMTLGGGNTYSATLPAQLDGAQVRFRVAATDTLGQTTLSPASGYFSGVTPISTLRINDADGVLVPKGYGARVEGDVTLEAGILNEFVSLVYVQDATGGVQIFDGELLPAARGDRVQFVGELEQFGGQTEINIAEDFGNTGFTVLGPGTLPAPQVVTVSQVGETLEGTLIRINSLTVTGGTIPELGSGSLTVTDDGGISTLTLRVDGDTDIPGANTPTQPFDLIGVASQFDSWVPLTSGYQILPRERTDFLTDEVNHPVLLISEIHADPASGLAGDANGDGVRDATDDEFIELVNTGFEPLDVSGYTLGDALQVRHVFAPGTVIPAREAVVVFGGGTPTGAFGNAAANGLVFTASSGSLSLNNSGDTVTLADDLAVTIQSVVYGSEGGQDESLVRDPDYSNAPLVGHESATGSGGSAYSPGARINGQAYTIGAGSLLLTEVMYDPSGSDDDREWFELYNATDGPLDLDDVCVGNGGGDYTSSLVGLEGVTLAAGATLVVGGPISESGNGSPVFDVVFDFSPDFQNSGSTADGVALFNVRCASVTPTTVPIDAVVYGGANNNALIDETGVANVPEVGDASSGSSIERIDLEGTWQIQGAPTPGVFDDDVMPPEPPAAGLVLSEVFYDDGGADDGFEWVELLNTSTEAIDLSSFSLGSGGSSYTTSQVQLAGVVAPGATFVVGGPSSDAGNGDPVYDQVFNFSPDFQNSGSAADGVALFALPAAMVTGSTVPIDAVVYGPTNSTGLIDETGVANAPEVGDASAGSSIERIDLAGTWQIQGSPTPNTTPIDLAPSPVAHWTLDEGAGATAADSAGSGLTGTLVGGQSWAVGPVAGALALDGVVDHVVVTDPGAASPLDLETGFTLALFVLPESVGGPYGLVSKDGSYELELGQTTPGLYSIRLDNVRQGEGATPVEAGRWQHLAVTWDGSTIRYYYDGVLDGSVAFAGPVTPNDLDLGLGARPSPAANGGPVFHLPGRLDDVRVYDEALAEADLAALAAAGSDLVVPVRSNGAPATALALGTTSTNLTLDTDEAAICRFGSVAGTSFESMANAFGTTGGTAHSTPISGLVDGGIYDLYVRCQDTLGNTNTDDLRIVFAVGNIDLASGLFASWAFDEGSGCLAADSVGGADGALGPACPGNAPTWLPAPGGLLFDGVDDEVTASTAGLVSTGITVSAWIDHPTANIFRPIVDHRDGDTDGYDLYLDAAGRPFVRVNGDTHTGSAVVADGIWHHLVATYDGSEIRIYVDGLLDSASPAGPAGIDVGSDLVLGRHYGTLDLFFGGGLDDVVIYDRAVSPAEALELFLTGR